MILLYRSGNIREVLIFAKRTNSRIQESHEKDNYNSATKEKCKIANFKFREKSQNKNIRENLNTRKLPHLQYTK